MKKLIYGTILSILIINVIFFGGVHWWVYRFTEITSVVLLLCWIIDVRRREEIIELNDAGVILLCFYLAISIVFIIQIIPLPEKVLYLISPKHMEYAKLLKTIDMFSFPNRLSLNLEATINGFIALTAFFIISILFAQLTCKINDLRKFVLLITIFGAALATFAIMQKLAWKGHIYGIEDVFNGYGTFINKNHCAAILNLMLFPCIAHLAYRVNTKSRTADFFERPYRWKKEYIYVISIMLIVAGVGYSGSRGAIISLAATTVFALMMLLLIEKSKMKNSKLLIKFTMAFFVILLITLFSLLSIYSSGEFFSDASLVGRVTGWTVSLNIIKDFFLFGSGIGTFGDVFLQYRPESMYKTYKHAHNEYIELLVELGIVGCLLISVFLVCFVREVLSALRRADRETQYIYAGIIFSLFALSIHNLAEFNLAIPANTIIIAIYTGILISPVISNNINFRFIGFRKVFLYWPLICSVGSLSLIIIEALVVTNYNNSLNEKITSNRQSDVQELFLPSELLNKKAKEFSEAGLYDESMRSYIQSLRKHPINGLTWGGLAIVELNKGNISLSEKLIQLATYFEPNNISLWKAKAELFLVNGNEEELVDLLHRLVTYDYMAVIDLTLRAGLKNSLIKDIFAQKRDILVDVGYKFLHMKKDSIAHELFMEAYKINANNDSLLDMIATFLIKNNIEGGMDFLSETIEKSADPRPRQFYWLGMGFRQLSKTEDAIKYFKIAYDMSKKIDYGVILVNLYLHSGDYDRVLELAKEMQLDNPDNIDLSLIIADVKYRSGNGLSVLDDLMWLTIKEPGRIDVKTLLVKVLNEMGMEQLLIKELINAIDIDPDSLYFRMLLTEKYFKTGAVEKSIHELDKLKIMSPNNPQIKKLERKILMLD